MRERRAGVDRLSYAALTASKLGPSELDALSGCESFAAFKYAALISVAGAFLLTPSTSYGLGVDVAIEAVGYPETLLTAASLVRPGGTIANVGVHGTPVELPMQDMWISNVTLTMGLVDTVSIPTLLKMVAGHLAPDGGNVKLGSVKMGYFAQQSLELLDSDLTIYEQVDQKFHLESVGVKRTLLGAFGFSGDDHEKRVCDLSGGEKSRLVLALMLFDPPNFLVLDEPTNHLDLDTKKMLVQKLSTFEGTILFVSHDRTFLRGLANRVLDVSACAAGGAPDKYPGSYLEWVDKTGTEAPGVHA